MRRLLQYRRVWLLLLLPICFLITSLAALFPGVIERFYSRGIYRMFANVFGRATTLLPFSLAEFLLVFGAVSLITYLILKIADIVRVGQGKIDKILILAFNLLCTASVIYGWFVLVCGLNYQRQTFAEYSGLQVHPSSVEELRAMCSELIEAANHSRAMLAEDANGVCAPVFSSSNAIAREAAATYESAGSVYPILGGYTPRPKPVLFSRVMSYLNITGIYAPFTFESNVNMNIPHFNIPATATHELAHFKGFMREQEANFIAYLACINSNNDLFVYSGNYLALLYATNALYAVDRDAYWRTVAGLSESVLRDIRASSDYWQEFETPIAEVATAMNNTYLKANRQESGVKSYGEMVDLLLANYRQQHEIVPSI